MSLSDDELERYARHVVLHEIGGAGQRRLRAARILVVGAGGLGCPALLYLAAAGAGTLGVIDDDTVSLSNLQRQVLFATAEVGNLKVDAARSALARLNDHVVVETHAVRLAETNADEVIGRYDLTLDGCDNSSTRYLVNAACIRMGKPLISAAMSQWEGQISLFHPAQGGPCYACIFPRPPAPGLVAPCAEAGVIGALPGVMGSMMALEAIKFVARAGTGLRGRMLIYDALHCETRRIALQARGDCSICGGQGL